VFAFPNVFHFFAHKLARLSGRRLAFALIFARAFNWFFFWHNKMISPLATRLDVKESGGSYLPPLVGSKEPVLSSALLTAALLTATLFFTLALLTFTLLSLSRCCSCPPCCPGDLPGSFGFCFVSMMPFLIIELVVWVRSHFAT
jgi:hypothetical protein